jgi:hypothetical protein
MKAQEVAKVLLSRRNAMNPIVMQGEMLNALQHDGLQEALQRRWLVPDVSSGYLMVSQDMTKVQEMRAIAEEAEAKEKDEKDEKDSDETKKKEWTKPWEKPNESHGFAMRHSNRLFDGLPSPGTGHDTSGPLTSAPTAPPQAPTSAPAAPTAARPPLPATPTASSRPANPAGAQRPTVGSQVVVVPKEGSMQGQTITGTVSRAAGGKVSVKFGTGGPEQEYPEADVRTLAPAA